MGLFSKKQRPPSSGGLGNISQQKARLLGEFGAMIFERLIDDGQLDATEIRELREEAYRMGLSQDDILKSKVFLTQLLMDGAIKAGYNKDEGAKLVLYIVKQLSKI